eukprot:TRINITY_DN25736_c0_g1_i1.p2 TRINITY_DN25736_c0_g1~~TRINITY_DN25736_c0_g1_i1.p2  ORF type:complete len:151 (-),score=30.94 TRINITY_DN25736_c0_g1_i1:26-478(-)
MPLWRFGMAPADRWQMDPVTVRLIAQLLLESNSDEEHESVRHRAASRNVVAFVSACRGLRVGKIPVCVGVIDNLVQCDRLRSAQSAYTVTEARVEANTYLEPVSYTHLRAHETPEHLVCRLLLEKKKNTREETQVVQKGKTDNRHEEKTQ